MTDLFLDASFAISLPVPSDQHHGRALALSQQLEAGERRLVTTVAVLLEIGNALAGPRYRHGAVTLIREIIGDPDTEVVNLQDVLVERAFSFFARHTDKSWGMVDCISFVVMQEHGITEALTADRHFVQAGFRALLLEDE
jgi:uncharacterized protein